MRVDAAGADDVGHVAEIGDVDCASRHSRRLA